MTETVNSSTKPVIIVNAQKSSSTIAQKLSNFRVRVSNQIVPDFILPTKGAAFQVFDGKYLNEENLKSKLEYLSNNYRRPFAVILLDRHDAKSWLALGIAQNLTQDLAKQVIILPSSLDKPEEVAHYMEIFDTALSADEQEHMRQRYFKTIENEKQPNEKVIDYLQF